MAKGLRIIGEKALQKRLASMSAGAQRRMARPAIREAIKPIRMTAKALAPRGTGLLRKSIKSVVRTGSKGVVYGVVGPAQGMKTTINGRVMDPTKYAHLVEFGTVRSQPKPFLRPAYDQHKGNASQIIQRRIKEEIKKEAAKKR